MTFSFKGPALALATLSVCLFVTAGCAPEEETNAEPTMAPVDIAHNDLSESEAADGWELLFDGESAEHFRAYQGEAMPAGWTVDAGVLAVTDPEAAADIVTRDTYRNFELKLDWRVDEGGNSGIMFHVTEDHDYPWETGPEMQILDNDAFEGGALGKNSSGSNYDVHPPMVDASRDAGEWNSVHLIVNGPHVEHWMNGQKIVEYEMWTDEWQEDVAGSKWANYPDYGSREMGHIAIQGDHNPVALRNIKIKRLPDNSSS